MNDDGLLALIQSAPGDNALKVGGDDYRKGFAAAFLAVYGHLPDADILPILKRKFTLSSTASNFNEDTFLQGASELSVAHHIKRQKVLDFATDKKVNPDNDKDVDAYCRVDGVRLSVEVKCAAELKDPGKGELTLRTAGRVPDHEKVFNDLRQQIEGAGQGTLRLGKNKDNTLKMFLIEASKKFNPQANVDDLNVVFVACEDHFNISSWHGYLYENEGLFTANPFTRPSEYKIVDVVILSNVKYRHKSVRSAIDWSLDDALILPFINPHGRAGAVESTIKRGLAVFNHHLARFAKYAPSAENPQVPAYVMDSVKCVHYVAEQLTDAERAKYFPTIDRWRA